MLALVLANIINLGAGLNITPIDPMKALFWSAVIHGMVAVPIMSLMIHLGGRTPIMGRFTLPRSLGIVGWLVTGVMALAAVGMFATMGSGS